MMICCIQAVAKYSSLQPVRPRTGRHAKSGSRRSYKKFSLFLQFGLFGEIREHEPFLSSKLNQGSAATYRIGQTGIWSQQVICWLLQLPWIPLLYPLQQMGYIVPVIWKLLHLPCLRKHIHCCSHERLQCIFNRKTYSALYLFPIQRSCIHPFLHCRQLVDLA